MNSYFFIPGTKLDKIKNIDSLGVYEIIIDIEDAVKGSDRKSAIKRLKEESSFKNHYIRIPLYSILTKEIDTTLLNELLNLGFNKFVFPKIKSFSDFEKIYDLLSVDEIKIILLIETPRLFFEAKQVLLSFTKDIAGIGIGSHDFMSEIGGEHTLENLEYLRQNILYLARMANIIPIDIASMELNDRKTFKAEVLDGFNKGYDAKFIIHPWQLSLINEINFYSKADYDWAKEVTQRLGEVKSDDEFNPIVINGEVIEKPHLNRAKKILKLYKHEAK